MVGEGVGVGVGVGAAEGVATGIGEGDAEGDKLMVGFGLGAAITVTPLLQTSFFPDLTQVNVLPAYTCFFPRELHELPALGLAALTALNDEKLSTETNDATRNFRKRTKRD